MARSRRNRPQQDDRRKGLHFTSVTSISEDTTEVSPWCIPNQRFFCLVAALQVPLQKFTLTEENNDESDTGLAHALFSVPPLSHWWTALRHFVCAFFARSDYAFFSERVHSVIEQLKLAENECSLQ